MRKGANRVKRIKPEDDHWQIVKDKQTGISIQGAVTNARQIWSKKRCHVVAAVTDYEDAKLIQFAPQLFKAVKNIREIYSPGISYCEFCNRHAPKDDDGCICGELIHDKDCPITQIDYLIYRMEND